MSPDRRRSVHQIQEAKQPLFAHPLPSRYSRTIAAPEERTGNYETSASWVKLRMIQRPSSDISGLRDLRRVEHGGGLQDDTIHRGPPTSSGRTTHTARHRHVESQARTQHDAQHSAGSYGNVWSMQPDDGFRRDT